MKRTVTIILLTLILLLSGCKATDIASADNTPSDINFTTSDFAIVRPADNNTLTSFGIKIFKAINATHSVKLSNIDDSGAPKPAEILIGCTNRPESAEALQLLDTQGTGRYGEYIICVLNGKIVINAFDDVGIEAAVDCFIENYCNEGIVSSELCYVLINDDGYRDITLCGESIRRYRFVIPQYNTSYLVTEEVEKIRQYIYGETGYMLEISDDTTHASDREIVVGNCSRDGVISGLKNDEYEIKRVNNSIYINGGRNYSVVYALQTVLKNLSESDTVSYEAIGGEYNGLTALDSGYRLVWKDEFDTLDRNVWNARNGKGSDSYGGWYGLTTYRSVDPKNLSARDGKLYITASYDSDYFYGAYITTSESLNFTYGYMEISARVADGYGIWHDFWTWSDNPDHLEFDIMECWSGANYFVNYLHEMRVNEHGVRTDNVPNWAYVTKHRHYNMNEQVKFLNEHEEWKSESMNLEFHTFGCEWTEEEVIFSRDGEVTMVHNYAGTENADLYAQPHYFILSMLVGSNYGFVEPEDIAHKITGILAPLPGADYWFDDRASFIVEYIHLFQKKGHYNDL